MPETILMSLSRTEASSRFCSSRRLAEHHGSALAATFLHDGSIATERIVVSLPGDHAASATEKEPSCRIISPR